MSRAGLTRPWLVGLLIASSIIFSGAAIYNGFPLVFPDSGGYVATQAAPFRSPFYGILILFFHLKTNLWPIVFVQGLVVAHVLYMAVRVVFGGVDVPRFLLLAVLMTGLTSLPWFSGQIMPDIFAPLLVLTLTMLAFCRADLNRLEIAYFFLLATGAIAVHTTHLPLAVGLVLVLLAVSLVLRRWGNFTVGALGLLVGPSVLATLALVSVNLVVYGAPSISPGGPGFLLARSYADGPAYQYLQEACPEAGYELCAHLERLPRDTEEFLWSPDSPFKQVNGFATLQQEASAIVREATIAYPGLQALAVWRHWLAQLVSFRTAEEMISYIDKPSPTRALGRIFPGAYPAYVESRQGQNRIPIVALAQLVYRL